MRTTLKRGVGRGATANGSNRATVPPGPLGPVTVYRQPPPPPRRGGSLVLQIFGWAALVLCVLVGGTAAGAYLYLHESVAAVAPKSVEVKAAAKRLDVPLPGQPAIALVIGYDHRANEAKGTPSRSDTLMLVRADPGAKTISLLSFPRDLRVDIYCPGQATYRDKINAAYSDCGAQGTLETVRKLTGVPINYIITVNFRGFRQLVDRLGGVWMDVDRRYYNNQGGPSGYAKINLQPGYQRLTGLRALDFVRFRHTDSDIYRNARQQQFVRAFKNQIDSAFSLTRLPQVIKIVTSNVEVGQGGGKNVSAKTVLSYGLSPTRCRRGTCSRRGSRGSRASVRPDDRPREHPDGRPRLREPGRRLAAEGDGGRARREGQAARARAARHVGDRAQRKRDRGLGLHGELPPLPTRLQDGAAAERHAGERAELRLLPDDRLLRRAHGGREGGRAEAREPVRLGGREEGDDGDPTARQRRDDRGGRRPDVPRPPRVGTGRPDAAARARLGDDLRGERRGRPPPGLAAQDRLPDDGADEARRRLVARSTSGRCGSTGSTPTASTRRSASPTGSGRTSTGASR